MRFSGQREERAPQGDRQSASCQDEEEGKGCHEGSQHQEMLIGPSTTATATLPSELSDNYVVQQEAWSSEGDVGHVRYDPASYKDDLEEKITGLLSSFRASGFFTGDRQGVDVFESPRTHYRMRAKFGVGVVMGAAPPLRLSYLMWDEARKAVRVDNFPIASRAINDLMPRLLAALESSPLLYIGLRAVSFLSTMASDMVVTLIYKKPLDPLWVAEAGQRVRDGVGVQVVGRSRGQVYCVDRDYAMEWLSLRDGRVLSYKQVEGSFSNPNGRMAECTLDWLCSVAASYGQGWRGNQATGEGGVDLLELYCGNGNHTVALSPWFRRVVGVEINGRLVEAARENLAANTVHNAHVIQIPSEKFQPRQLQQPAFAGPFPDSDYHFRVVLVDPPRAGLDKHTRRLVSSFPHVMYISCDPRSLLRDLHEGLGVNHDIIRMAVFDHFPYTRHIECGVYLRRRGLISHDSTGHQST